MEKERERARERKKERKRERREDRQGKVSMCEGGVSGGCHVKCIHRCREGKKT